MSGTSAATISLCGVRVKIALIALCCLVAQTTAAVVLTRYSKMIADTPRADGTKREKYSNSSLVVSTEFVKLMASLLLVFLFDTVEKLQAEAKTDRDGRGANVSVDVHNSASPATPALATTTTVTATAANTATVPADSTAIEVAKNSGATADAIAGENSSSSSGGGVLSPNSFPAPPSPTPTTAATITINGGDPSAKNGSSTSNFQDTISHGSVLMGGGVTDAVPRLLSPRGLRLRYAAWKAILYKDNLKDLKGTLKLSVPALLYTVQNNVIYTALNNLEATTFQVGYQSKVVTTAVLSVLMLNRSLTPLKWVALLVLTAGIVLTQLQPATDGKKPTRIEGEAPADGAPATTTVLDFDVDTHNNQFIGMIAVMVASFCSAFAGVYFEKVLKGTAPSVWVRNAQLAFFSMLVGLVGYVFSLDPDEPFRALDYFKGYDVLVAMLIAVQALGGLIIACVVKYADNILKGFATAMSIVLCGVLSAMFMGFFPNFMFVLGSGVVILATLLYSKPDKK